MKTKCPFCGDESITLLQRMFAGGMASKGVKCKSCGNHCVKGMKSTIFRTFATLVIFVDIILTGYAGVLPPLQLWIVIALAIVGMLIFDGFFCNLEKHNRNYL